MKKKFLVVIILTAFVFGLTVIGCSNDTTSNNGNSNGKGNNNGNGNNNGGNGNGNSGGGGNGSGSDTAVTLSNIIGNGSSSQTTTQLTLTFSQAITGLSANDITITGLNGVTKGTLSGSNPYTLPISGFTESGTLNVAVSKTGYTISGSPKNVTVYYNPSNINVTFSNLTANGNALTNTTELTLTFSQAITGLTESDITLSGISGIIKGTLSGSGSTYTLPISGFTESGILSVAVSKSGYAISNPTKTINIYYYTPPTVGIVIDLAGINEWQLIEQAVQITFSEYKSFTVNGTYTAYRWYLDGVPVGTSSSYILINKPVGVYQLAVVVTNSSGESRSGRCRITVTAPAPGNGSNENPFPLMINTWLNGNIIFFYADVTYSFPVTSGMTYRIWWNDRNDGDSTKTLNVKVSATYSNGTSIFTNVDSGWTTAQAFTANQTGMVKIVVVPYSLSSTSTGTFAVAYSTSSTRP